MIDSSRHSFLQEEQPPPIANYVISSSLATSISVLTLARVFIRATWRSLTSIVGWKLRMSWYSDLFLPGSCLICIGGTNKLEPIFFCSIWPLTNWSLTLPLLILSLWTGSGLLLRGGNASWGILDEGINVVTFCLGARCVRSSCPKSGLSRARGGNSEVEELDAST